MGNVLVHFSHGRMCQNIAALCEWNHARTKAFLLDEGRQWKLERGEITEQQFHAEFCEASGKSLDIDALRHAAADIFWLNDSIVPVLHELKSAGLKLVLLSNTSVTHVRFIERHYDILKLMDDRVTSYETGAMKPDKRIFEAALAKAGCDPIECFYTDDIEEYVRKAASFGIHSHQYTTTENLQTALRDLQVLR